METKTDIISIKTAIDKDRNIVIMFIGEKEASSIVINKIDALTLMQHLRRALDALSD